MHAVGGSAANTGARKTLASGKPGPLPGGGPVGSGGPLGRHYHAPAGHDHKRASADGKLHHAAHLGAVQLAAVQLQLGLGAPYRLTPGVSRQERRHTAGRRTCTRLGGPWRSQTSRHTWPQSCAMIRGDRTGSRCKCQTCKPQVGMNMSPAQEPAAARQRRCTGRPALLRPAWRTPGRRHRTHTCAPARAGAAVHTASRLLSQGK